MKVLIAYYSRTGNNEKLANELQLKLECDIEKIIDTVNRKGVWGFLKGGYQASRKKMSRIEPIKKDPSGYDLVIIAYPLWGNRMPPPIRKYIFDNKNNFNRVALMSVSGRGKGNDKTVPDFETAVGKKASAILMLSQTEKKRGGYEEKLKEFSESISKL